VVSPSTLSSNIGTVNENSDKVFFSTRKVTTDLIYGPYVYLLPGRYCLNLNVIVKGDYDLFKWYIADAITDKFYVMNETKLPMDQKVLDDSLCFDNVTPHFPKEIKVYGKDFEGSIRFQELAFSRTPM
uniref:hypothetical protein n=1 Tax=Endozoicomonas sp. ONNA1 TaxID=2828740 RepID=UPI0021495EC4